MIRSTPPLVSVVMPAYNAGTTIGAALSSLRTQSITDLEVVVVDDGSTDHTADVVRTIAPEARLVSQANAGVGAARARGIAEASGRFVAFCDADDLFFDRHLEALLTVWERAAAGGVATANAYWWLPGGIEPRRQRHRGRFPRPDRQRIAIVQSNFVSTMSLFERRLVDEIGTIDATLRQGEDWEFWIRAVYAGKRVVHQPRPLALYRWSTAGLSAQTAEFHAAEHAILGRLLDRPDLSAEERAAVESRLAAPTPNELTTGADNALVAADYATARRLFMQAAELIPDETPLVQKARLMRLAPHVAGPLLRQRQLRRNRVLGIDERHAR
jgi:GT2 family glycosyltransferase